MRLKIIDDRDRGGEVLARGREEEGEPAEGEAIRPRADNTVEDGLNKIVTMLKDNKSVGDAYNDVEFEGIGGDVRQHVYKIYKPEGHPQIDTKEHQPTMDVMGVETVKPQVTGSIELIEDQLVYQKRTGTVTTDYR